MVSVPCMKLKMSWEFQREEKWLQSSPHLWFPLIASVWFIDWVGVLGSVVFHFAFFFLNDLGLLFLVNEKEGNLFARSHIYKAIKPFSPAWGQSNPSICFQTVLGLAELWMSMIWPPQNAQEDSQICQNERDGVKRLLEQVWFLGSWQCLCVSRQWRYSMAFPSVCLCYLSTWACPS